MLDERDLSMISEVVAAGIRPLADRMDVLTDRVDGLTEQVGTLTDRMDGLTEQVGTLTNRVDDLAEQSGAQMIRMDGLTVRMDDLTSRVDHLSADVEVIKADVHEMKFVMENDIRRDIYVIAEGHLDLSRKLDGALRVENEREMALIRLGLLEKGQKRLDKDVARIKERLAMA